MMAGMASVESVSQSILRLVLVWRFLFHPTAS